MRGEIVFKSSLEEPIAVSKTSSKVGERLAISAVIFSQSKVLIAVKSFFRSSDGCPLLQSSEHSCSILASKTSVALTAGFGVAVVVDA